MSLSKFRVVAGLPTIAEEVKDAPGAPPNEWQLLPEHSRSYHWERVHAFDVEQARLRLEGREGAEAGHSVDEAEAPANEVRESENAAISDGLESPLSWPSTPVKVAESCHHG